ncbi:recombinase family protein [Candidatus Methylacidiphilum infernorum]|uniref:recombinase family protein n=1 Tax=Candidatus Methylacidiphilum infernorum TaxID=511746 RepID=UPI0011D079EA
MKATSTTGGWSCTSRRPRSCGAFLTWHWTTAWCSFRTCSTHAAFPFRSQHRGKRGNGWQVGTLYRLLTNTVYMGRYCHRRARRQELDEYECPQDRERRGI